MTTWIILSVFVALLVLVVRLTRREEKLAASANRNGNRDLVRELDALREQSKTRQWGKV